MDLLKDLERELTCPIHLDLFDNPVQLPCLHSICRGEVAPLSTSSSGAAAILFSEDHVVCPVCKAHARKQDIKQDFRTQRLLDVYKARVERLDKEIKCGGCGEDIAVTWCYRCGVYLCGRCQRTHDKITTGSGLADTHKTDSVKTVTDLIEERRIKLKSWLNSMTAQYESAFHHQVDTIATNQNRKRAIDDKRRSIQNMLTLNEAEISRDIRSLYASMHRKLKREVEFERYTLQFETTLQRDYNQHIKQLREIIEKNDTKTLLDWKAIETKLKEIQRIQSGMNTLPKVRSSGLVRLDHVMNESQRVARDLKRAIDDKKQVLEKSERTQSEILGTNRNFTDSISISQNQSETTFGINRNLPEPIGKPRNQSETFGTNRKHSESPIDVSDSESSDDGYPPFKRLRPIAESDKRTPDWSILDTRDRPSTSTRQGHWSMQGRLSSPDPIDGRRLHDWSSSPLVPRRYGLESDDDYLL